MQFRLGAFFYEGVAALGNPKYKEWIEQDGLLRVTGWGRDGLTDAEIALKIGVRPATFCDWKKRFPQLAKALKDARAPVAVEIENAFFSRCQWRTVTETTVRTWEGRDGKEHKEVTTQERVIPPDTACLIYAVKNWIPQRYTDKPVDKSKDVQKLHSDLVAAIKAAAADD